MANSSRCSRPGVLNLRVAILVIFGLLITASAAPALSILDPFNIPGTLDGGVAELGKDIAYADGPRHTLDVYAPQNPAGPAPVVVFIYGGAWKFGSKNDYPFVGHALAAKGFVTVIPDYRLVPDVQYPGFLQDNAAAIKWVEDNIGRYGGDPKRVFLVGHSAGAYDAVVLGMDSSFLREAGATIPIRGVVGISGPYAVYPFEFSELQAAFGNTDNPQLTQPINMPTDEAVPLLLLQGSTDLIVNPDNTARMKQKFSHDKRSLSAKIYEGLGHMEPIIALSQIWRWRSPVLDDIVAFLDANGAFDLASLGPVDLLPDVQTQPAVNSPPDGNAAATAEAARAALDAIEAAARSGRM